MAFLQSQECVHRELNKKIIMENLRYFLESTSIHGLSFISTANRSIVRIFWVTVVIMGFTGAGFLIYKSFQSWNESPVTTTIETQPTTEITFPKVIVCPPRDTYTDLNYDLVMTENETLSDDIRGELAHYAVELLYDQLYDDIMRNLSMMEERDRYYNWYHGYSEIRLPSYSNYYNRVEYSVLTSAVSGNVSSQYFGEKFNVDKMEKGILFSVRIHPPDRVSFNPNATLHYKIEKMSMKHLSSGYDNLIISGNYLSVDKTQAARNYTPPIHAGYVTFTRNVDNMQDVRKQRLSKMPGFRFMWHYSGIEVMPDALYSDYPLTKAFVR